MIPKGSEGIGHLAHRLMVDLLPKAATPYAGADLAMIAQLLALVGQDYDRAVDVMILEHGEICEILRDSEPRLGDPHWSRRIQSVLAATPSSFRVQALTARADIALQALIDLQARIEEEEAGGASWAAALNRRIWRFLEGHVERHSYQLAL
jgi:hypothetical protein